MQGTHAEAVQAWPGNSCRSAIRTGYYACRAGRQELTGTAPQAVARRWAANRRQELWSRQVKPAPSLNAHVIMQLPKSSQGLQADRAVSLRQEPTAGPAQHGPDDDYEAALGHQQRIPTLSAAVISPKVSRASRNVCCACPVSVGTELPSELLFGSVSLTQLDRSPKPNHGCSSRARHRRRGLSWRLLGVPFCGVRLSREMLIIL